MHAFHGCSFGPFRSDLRFAFTRVHIPFAVDVSFGKDLPDSVDDFRIAFCQIILARKVLRDVIELYRFGGVIPVCPPLSQAGTLSMP